MKAGPVFRFSASATLGLLVLAAPVRAGGAGAAGGPGAGVPWGDGDATPVAAEPLAQGTSPMAEPAALLPAEPGVEFLASALAGHHVVLLGNTHRRPELLSFEAHAVEVLAEAGLVTHLGLEIASDQQEALDRFLATGRGLDRIEVAPAIDHPAFRDLLQAIRPVSRPGGGKVEVVALDRPWRSVREGTRDGHMASRIAGEIEGRAAARMLVLVGNNHTLRDFPWRWGGSARFIPGELSRLRPDLKVVSIHECVDTGPSSGLRADLHARLPPGPGPWAVRFDAHLGDLDDDSVSHLNAAPGVTPGMIQDAVIFFGPPPPPVLAAAPAPSLSIGGADADGSPP